MIMTAGFGAGDARPTGAEPDDVSGRAAERPGPLPPRIEPHPEVGATWPGAPGQSAEPSAAVPAPRTGWVAPPNAGQWGAAPQGPLPAGPHATTAAPGTAAAHGTAAPGMPAAHGTAAPYATGPAPYGPGTYNPGTPTSYGAGGYPPAGDLASAPPFATAGHPGQPGNPGQPGWPGVTPPARPTRRRWPRALAVLLVVALAAVAGLQAYQLNRLDDRLAATDRRLAQAQDGDGTRLDGLEQRADALEKQAGAAFNPEAVASAVLPSVFRVRAGQFTGTAFAVGKPAAGGGTNLFTNFHVVESVWESGGRQVFLERTDQRFPATIVKVDKANDVAHLRATGKFTGLVTAPTAVKSGQQIIVVGAPLGLEDSVTTGVVSALRAAQGGSGPAIQFDAPINPGNSGGPVINGSKQVVGIATAKARDAEGIGLAIPIKVACDGFKIC
ncbi:S1C family serine protease [Micromonospora lupini]|uniref:Peptidase S1 and S6, chymotrypsin/Hap n=1 Tax=Micromonospora lupini str. Lupac 08 TaxID=1150864 RepID=I0KZ04_9ACTN|nr:Peptidase S1 and S6, chymotrypsin/Hap [Micromonospora lupini str. Lupac 08]